MKRKYVERVGFYATKEMKKWLDAFCEKQQIDKSRFIREMVDRAQKEHGQSQTMETS